MKLLAPQCGDQSIWEEAAPGPTPLTTLDASSPSILTGYFALSMPHQVRCYGRHSFPGNCSSTHRRPRQVAWCTWWARLLARHFTRLTSRTVLSNGTTCSIAAAIALRP